MKKLFPFLFSFFAVTVAQANNVQISGISFSQPNISFTITWDNSWNTTNNINPLYPNNWDGVWVFIKYQNAIDNLWKPGRVSTNAADHSITGGILEINPSADGLGVFIRRSAAGSGNISATTVTLKLNPLNGSGSFNFKVFGTEMVYIPQSDFQIGDGNAGANYFTPQTINAASQTNGFAVNALFSGSPAIPAAFPLGYNAYYMMKYEISFEQWADFLNTLTYDQQANRMDIAPNSAANNQIYTNNVNTIGDNILKIQSAGSNNTMPATIGCDLNGNNIYNEIADGQNTATAMISKGDLFAFLDWSGLRPMTETEFEKGCRGTQARVLNEFAWGTTEVSPHTRPALSNLGQPTENWAGVVANGQVIATTNINSQGGPGRTGVYATTSTGRASAGAGFYGNMELSGNVWEFAVQADATGAAFTGNHGDGVLTTTGDADAVSWPPATGNTGTIARGGSWFEVSSYTQFISTSYRGAGAQGPARDKILGGRGVRTAP